MASSSGTGKVSSFLNTKMPPSIMLSVQPHVFKAMETMNIDILSSCPEAEIRPVLPSLIRMALYPPLDSSKEGKEKRKRILSILSNLEAVNGIVNMLSIDFHSLEQDVKKEQQLRSKLGGNSTESVLISQLTNGIALEFERSQGNSAQRIRLLLSELLFIVSELKDDKGGFYQKHSDLFESKIYKDEIMDALCISIAELPQLLNVMDLAEALLCVANGPDFVCQMVANSPESFLQVCQHVIVRGDKCGEDTVGGRIRFELLTKLCAMNRTAALLIRNLCVEHSSMPGFAVAMSLQASISQSPHGASSAPDSMDVDADDGAGGAEDDVGGGGDKTANVSETCDIVPFLSGILLGSDIAARNWISNYIKIAQKQKPEWSSLSNLRRCLLELVHSLTPDAGQSLSQEKVVQACALLRLYSALKAIATLKFSDEEVTSLLFLVISRPCVSPSGAHFLSLAICFLMACPGIVRTLDEEQQLISWLKMIMSSDDHLHKYSNDSSSPREMLFLLALHFHNNQMQAVTELVCNTLRMKCTVKSSALVKIRQIFTMELFTEQVIASHAIKIPVTLGLDSKSTGYLPVHSILQLLKSRAFSKHKVSVKKWVFNQIKESRFPLHPLLPQLVESYINTVIPKSVRPEHTNEPLDDDDIFDVFHHHQQQHASPSSKASLYEEGGKQSSRCSQLLILYYLLLYEDQYQTHKKMIDVRKLQPYSERVISEIPISILVQEALQHKNNCQNLFPPMIRLLSTHFPHLCLVEDWLDMNSGLLRSNTSSSSSSSPSSTSSSSSSSSLLSSRLSSSSSKSSAVSSNRKTYFTAEEFSQALSNACLHPGAAIRSVERVLDLNDLTVLQSCQEAIVASVPMMLQPSMPQRLQTLLKKVWFRLHAIIPRRLRVSTVNALHSSCGQQSPLVKASVLSEQDLVVDPLVILRCDDRVFRCPPVLEILLRILSAYRQACRVYLNAHASDVAGSVEKEKDRHELKTALLATQDSAIVQILLEVCQETDSEAHCQGELSELREVRCLIFSYIHQVFIADPTLAKLVHFQGYPYQLVPLVVSGVPSMHICLDFIPELLGQPQRSKQIFGIQLLAHLCVQFHIPKAMHVAKLGIDVMFTLLSVLEKEEWVSFFLQTLPSLVLMCRVFPPLCHDASSLLSQLGRVCYSQMTVIGNPSTNSDSHPDVGKSYKDVTKDEGMNPYDKLYSTIQTTFSQLCNRSNLYS